MELIKSKNLMSDRECGIAFVFFDAFHLKIM
jgi:hypothetical protein